MKKVLLTSASAIFLKKNSSLLRQRGFQLFTATNGVESLRLHEEHHFDLILSDLKLEDMGGCTLCSLIRNQEKEHHIPVILFCHNIPGSIERIEMSGASAMLLKPIQPIQLLEAIDNFIAVEMVRSKRVMLKVKVLSRSPDREFICISHDISTTGILLETLNQLVLGSMIVCQFSLPGSAEVEIAAEISRSLNTWECSNLYGAKFINISAAHSKAITSYIASVDASTPGSEVVTTH